MQVRLHRGAVLLADLGQHVSGLVELATLDRGLPEGALEDRLQAREPVHDAQHRGSGIETAPDQILETAFQAFADSRSPAWIARILRWRS